MKTIKKGFAVLMVAMAIMCLYAVVAKDMPQHLFTAAVYVFLAWVPNRKDISD